LYTRLSNYAERRVALREGGGDSVSAEERPPAMDAWDVVERVIRIAMMIATAVAMAVTALRGGIGPT
jgi:hypothetical protein